MKNQVTFPRTITLIDADIELFTKEVNSLEAISNEIKWAGDFNKERTDVWATDSEFNFFVNGENLTFKKH